MGASVIVKPELASAIFDFGFHCGADCICRVSLRNFKAKTFP